MPKCNSMQKLSRQGLCSYCPIYQAQSPDGKACVKIVCDNKQSLTLQGTCQDCPFGHVSSKDGKFCQKVQENASELCTERQIFNDVRCVDCKDYTKPNVAKDTCIRETCQPNYVLNKKGICEESAPVLPSCANREYLSTNNLCIPCPDYTIPSEDKSACISPECSSRDIVDADGNCQSCPDFKVPVQEKRECATPSCLFGQTL